MIKITIELYPHGDEERKFIIGEGTIINDMTGTINSGNYRYEFITKKSVVGIGGRVIGFKRNKKHIWSLLKECLKEVK
jgi:hypothetical protein